MKRSDIVIVWDPTKISAEDYAKLVVAIGDLVRAKGGLGIERIDPSKPEVQPDISTWTPDQVEMMKHVLRACTEWKCRQRRILAGFDEPGTTHFSWSFSDPVPPSGRGCPLSCPCGCHSGALTVVGGSR